MCVLQERRQRPRAVKRLVPRPHSWPGWAGIRTQICLTMGEDTQNKVGFGVTERSSDNGDTEGHLGVSNSFHLVRKCGQGMVSDTMFGPW